jgi:peptidoglycan glycosyltransferase
MNFTHEINRLTTGLLILLGIVALAATYWAVTGPDTILLRQDNPRLVQAESQIHRGEIVDRNNTSVATSTMNSDGSFTRQYLYPEMDSALGYASIRYGVGGAEAAFNSVLRGDDADQDFLTQLIRELLHRTQHGSDVRLTFDLSIQQEAVRAMGGHTGSVVVLDIPSGQVLAMVSLPTYDPNTLDANWEALSKAPGNPFFNRALQGAYQPGTALQTPLMAAALLANYPLDTSIPEATQSIKVGDVTIQCVTTPPSDTLTLQQAYAYGCPYPFAKMVRELGVETIQSGFNTFQLEHPPTLAGYVVAQPTPSADSNRLLFGTKNFTDNALGQGTITVSPLEMAVIAGAIFNDGNAPMPYSLLQVRQPDSEAWINDKTTYASMPMLTANSARQMQTLMEAAVKNGAAQAASQNGLTIGGHAALAYVGNTTQSWFIGFVSSGSNQGATIAVILEDTHDASLAAQIGGRVLAAAHAYQLTATPPPKAGA